MGNREDLLAGAQRCLLASGYSRTTARDIATESGVSLAAIGYHFGSKEALMNQALVEATHDWSDALEQAVAEIDPAATPIDRFVTAWDKIAISFQANRPLWSAGFELVAQIDHAPAAQELFAGALRALRPELAKVFEGEGASSGTSGTVYHVLLMGVLAQWLIDPGQGPDGREIADGLLAIAGRLRNSS
jgi:AcrR family transcriptional regulator